MAEGPDLYERNNEDLCDFIAELVHALLPDIDPDDVFPVLYDYANGDLGENVTMEELAAMIKAHKHPSKTRH